MPDPGNLTSLAPHAHTDGTRAFLFTDIEGSTQHWERAPAQMQLALARHDGILRAAITQAGGEVFKTVGDAFCAAFAKPSAALAAALSTQRALAADGFTELGGLTVRMAVHAGAAEARGGDFFGQSLNRVARLLSAGHGGQVLVSSAAAELARGGLPSGASLIGLGPHRLKDLAEPQEIFQLAAPGLRAGFPPLRTLTALNNLPQQVTAFIGRETEMADVTSLVGKHRLVTLLGSGGVGKTRLSLQVAADLFGRYPDGVWLVELAPITDPDLVAEVIAGLLGAPLSSGSSPVESLAAILKPKQLLLILDNCEHLVTEVARLADAILRKCPNVTFLASSREPLAIAGESLYRMPSLGYPDRAAGITAAEALEHAAVQLFAERARAAVAGFAVTDGNAPAVAEICKRLDGLALAIELAAPRLKMLKPEELAKRLDNRFRILTGGSRTALPRQQTLRALIDWSYNLLTEAERTLLRRLSVFAGGWTLDGAGAVASGEPLEEWEIFDLLASLFDKSLVVADSSGRETRYRMLESTRQYAAEKLAESGECGWPRRLAEYLVTFYARAAETWPTTATEPWIETYEPELGNLRAAVEWALAPGGDAGLGLDLIGHSMRLRFELALFPELIRDVEAGIARIDNATAPASVARLWLAKNFCIDSFGNPAAAAAALRAVETYRGLADPQALGVALTRAGASSCAPGETAEGEAMLREARAILQPLGRSKHLAECLDLLGTCQHFAGRAEAARQLLTQSAQMHRALGDKSGLRKALNNLAETEFVTGRLEQAVEVAREIMDAFPEERERSQVMLVRSNLAGYLLALGQIDAAADAAKESLRDLRSVGGRPNYVVCTLEHLTSVAAERGRFEQATRLLGYLEAWYAANPGFFREGPELASYERTRALLAASSPGSERARLLAEGAAWTEEQAAEQALDL